MVRHWALWGTGIIVLMAATLIWLAQPGDAGESGIVQVEPVASPASEESAESASVAATPVAPVEGASPDAGQLYALVRSEERDEIWAARSESAIAVSLRSVPYVGRGQPLEVRCAATICEVTGVAAAGSSPEVVQLAWQSLEQVAKDSSLASQGLSASTATFGSGRSLHAFTIYYRRR